MGKTEIDKAKPALSRRSFLAGSATLAASLPLVTQVEALDLADSSATEPRQAMGVKVGEVTDSSAIVWLRLTAAATRNNTGPLVKGYITGKESPPLPAPVAQLEGACPGAPGLVRLRYSPRADLARAKTTRWVAVTAPTDFSHQFTLTGLQPGTVYYYAAETAGPEGKPRHGEVRGRFETAPPAAQAADLAFCVLSCQAYSHLDHPAGFKIYPAMLKVQPKFVVFTGDNVYYDNEAPRATTPELARYHWQRMYSLPRHLELFRTVATYWEKDDHDTLDDDAWPGSPSKQMAPLTFAAGQQLYRAQVPLGALPYRTFRWGKHLQVWFTEGRDFRTPNKEVDSPQKTIWGAAQKEWLKRTLLASDATWKVLVSPTPLVGPDRVNKNDNHSNRGYQHEGDEIRAWFQAHVPNNFFVVCGDRHWQYHSVHPTTGLHEFSVGGASDEHAGGSPGHNPRYHKFHRVKGGFLSIAVTAQGQPSTIKFRHHDVNGQVVYEWQQEQSS